MKTKVSMVGIPPLPVSRRQSTTSSRGTCRCCRDRRLAFGAVRDGVEALDSRHSNRAPSTPSRPPGFRRRWSRSVPRRSRTGEMTVRRHHDVGRRLAALGSTPRCQVARCGAPAWSALSSDCLRLNTMPHQNFLVALAVAVASTGFAARDVEAQAASTASAAPAPAARSARAAPSRSHARSAPRRAAAKTPAAAPRRAEAAVPDAAPTPALPPPPTARSVAPSPDAPKSIAQVRAEASKARAAGELPPAGEAPYPAGAGRGR